MALEIPSALIREIQLVLRREAGVPSYDPADPSLPTLPTLHEAISSLDPSLPSHLRCMRCRGGLLRGLESTVCVFCGADRRKEAPPQTVSFNSTAGCRKLLESLDLDGSEAVTLDTESSDSSKGQDATKEGLVLSGLLDFELRWPLDTEEIDNSRTNKSPSQNSYALNLSGVDLDTFFSDTKKEITSTSPSLSSEQLMPKKQIINRDNHVSSGAQNIGFFENLQSSDMSSSVDTKVGEFSDSFSAWEADFQSASSETFAAESKSVDLFRGSSTAEFASPVTTEATVGHQTDIEHETSNESNRVRPTNDEGQLSSSDNWIQDDPWSQMNREVVNTADQFKSFGETNNAEVNNDLNNTTSGRENWVQDDLWPTSSTEESKNTKNLADNDDSFDAWQDFTSSGEAPGSLLNSWTQNVTEASSTKEFNNTENVDDNDDSLDAWQDFTSSGEALGGLSNSWTQNGTEASSIQEFNNTKNVDDNDDFLDAWQDFTSSGEAPGGLSTSWTQNGALAGQEGSREANNMQLDPSVSDRMKGMDAGSADSTISGARDVSSNFTAAANLESSNSNVEKLLSQMHDLSFMLENSLSIPKKVEGSGLNP